MERLPTIEAHENNAPFILIISGPTGAGKDTIRTAFQKKIPGLKMIVTCTDRSPRDGETDGVDYQFITSEKFDELVHDNMFAEWVRTGKSRKGTLKRDLLEKNANPKIWRIDMSRSGDIPDLPNETQLSKSEAEELKNRLVVVFVGTRSLFTQKNRALKRDGGNMTRDEYRNRLRQDWEIWKKYNDRFTSTEPVGGVRYYLIFNEDPADGQTIEDAASNLVHEVCEMIYQK